MNDTELLFAKAQMQPGMHVADLGCGRLGHVVFPAARFVGESGLVYAVDVLKDCIENIKREAAYFAMHNVETVWSDLEKFGKTSIPNKNLDVGFIINVLWHSSNPIAILEEARRLLKDKARLVVVDWVNTRLGIGLKEDNLVDFEKIKSWARINGFAIQEDFAMGDYHKGVVLYRHD